MKFEIKNLKGGGIILLEKTDKDLIKLGDIYLKKQNKKNDSYCNNNESNFNYHGIENELCGKSIIFIPKRFFVIQIK